MLKKLRSLLFENASPRQTVAKNTVWMGVGQIGGRLLRATIIIYAARVLGAEAWGTFSYAVSFIALLTLFTDLGVGPVLTREAAKNSDAHKRAEFIATSFFIKLILLGVALIVILTVAPRFASIERAIPILPLVALIMVFDGLREFGFSITRALERMEWEAGLYLATNLAIVVSGVIALSIAPNTSSFSLAYVVGTGIGMLLTFLALRSHFANLRSHFNLRLVQPILRSAWPFAVSTVLGGLTINTDLIIIGYFLSAADVGYYAAAERPILLLYLLPSILANSIFPIFSRLAGTQNEKMRRAFEQAICSILLAAFPIALGGIILAPNIIALIYGAEYLPAIPTFQVLLVTLLVNFPAVMLSNAIFAFNRQKSLVIFTLIGGVGNITLDLLLVPRFGIVGSAITTLIAQGLANLYLWRTMQSIISFRILAHLKKIALASIGMALWTAAVQLTFGDIFFSLTSSILVYFGILFVLKEPLLKEVRLVLRPTA